MKKFLWLSFSMVVLTCTVSFAQTKIVENVEAGVVHGLKLNLPAASLGVPTRTVNYYNSGGPQRLFFTMPSIASNTSMPDESYEVGVTIDTTGLEPGVSVFLMGVNTMVDYDDGTTEVFTNNDDLTQFSNNVPFHHSRGVYLVTYSFDLHFTDGHSESYYVMDSYQ